MTKVVNDTIYQDQRFPSTTEMRPWASLSVTNRYVIGGCFYHLSLGQTHAFSSRKATQVNSLGWSEVSSETPGKPANLVMSREATALLFVGPMHSKARCRLPDWANAFGRLLVNSVSVVRHRRYIAAIDRNEFRSAFGSTFAIWVAILLSLIGLAMTVYLSRL